MLIIANTGLSHKGGVRCGCFVAESPSCSGRARYPVRVAFAGGVCWWWVVCGWAWWQWWSR
ncbi:hypothetical protein HMPREF0574_0292, partial [Mobiluncus curtisii subsp. curtisii ATCC 35241]